MNTNQLAAVLHIKAKSIHKRYSKTGAYYCLRPIKLPNRQLLWPADSIAQLTGVQ